MTTSAVTGDMVADATAPGSSSAVRGVQSAGTTGNNSDVDSEVQSNKPLFLNFNAELAPFNSAKRQKRKSNVYKVSGVNILNRNSVDSKTALERLQRRRENHNFVERRRRDNINHTITTLSTLIPYCTDDSVKLNKGSILHMAVDYIRDLQDINAALSEENARLGGSVGATLSESLRQQRIQQQQERQHGSSNNSGIDTMPHSGDEDEMDDDEHYSHTSPMLSSAATSPHFVPANSCNKNQDPTSLASSRASSSSALSSAGSSSGSSSNSGRVKGEDSVVQKGKKRSNSSIAGNHNRSGSRNDVAVASCEKKALCPPSSRTAISLANLSPIAFGAPSQMPLSANSNVSMMSPSPGSGNQKQHRNLFHSSHIPQKNASLGSPGRPIIPPPPSQKASAQSVPHSPVYSGLTHSYDSSNTASGSQTPLPPIGSITPGGRILASGIMNASLAIQQHQQHQHMSAMHNSIAMSASNDASAGPGRLPAQSMPSSPNLRSFKMQVAVNKGPQHEGGVGSAGNRHSSRQTPGAFNTHPFFNSDVSSIRHHIQQQAQSLHRQQQQRAYPGSHSLQNTPLIRPSRDSVFGDGFELPPIHLNPESAKRPKQSQQQQ